MATKSAGAAPASDGEIAPAPEQAEALHQVADLADGQAEEVGAAIQRWWVEHIHNSPVAVATDAYNHIHSRLSALKAEIVAAIQKEI